MSAHPTDSGRSGLAAGTGLHAPKPTLEKLMRLIRGVIDDIASFMRMTTEEVTQEGPAWPHR
jgi:hypothetical protein